MPWLQFYTVWVFLIANIRPVLDEAPKTINKIENPCKTNLKGGVNGDIYQKEK